MSNCIIDPEKLSQDVIVQKEIALRYFMSKPLKERIVQIHFVVEENATLYFTLVDFAAQNLDCHLLVDLKRGAKVYLDLACINTKNYQKKFNFDVNHQESDTFSRVNMCGINAGCNLLKFLGNSTIENGSHRSDTRQEGRITNLHPDAKSEASPALLIKENDVMASHGAALGAYNQDELYYLMSRGLSLQESKKLITFGSLLPVIEKLEDEALMNQAKEVLEGLDI